MPAISLYGCLEIKRIVILADSKEYNGGKELL